MTDSSASVTGPIPYTDDDLDSLTRTIWGEARGEEPAGWAAIAWVVRNRAAHRPPAWWGHGIAAVCRKPRQFSCWNAEDPNSAKLAALDRDDPLYLRIAGVCAGVLDGKTPDPTGGADHYEVVGTGAAWAREHEPTTIIGHHAFYALGPSA